MDEQLSNVIELQDENGNDIPFDHLMTIEHEGSYYVVLEAVQDMDDCMEGEVLILKIAQDESGEDIYITIEDEKELQAVFDKCVAAMEEEDSADVEELDDDTEEMEEDD